MSTQGPRSSQMRRSQRVSAHIRIRREAPQNAPFALWHTPLMIPHHSCKGFPCIKRIDFPGVANFRSDKSEYATISLEAWDTMSIRNQIISCVRRSTQEMAWDRLVNRHGPTGQSARTDWSIGTDRLVNRHGPTGQSARTDWSIGTDRLVNRYGPTGQSVRTDWSIGTDRLVNRYGPTGQSVRTDQAVPRRNPPWTYFWHEFFLFDKKKQRRCIRCEISLEIGRKNHGEKSSEISAVRLDRARELSTQLCLGGCERKIFFCEKIACFSIQNVPKFRRNRRLWFFG